MIEERGYEPTYEQTYEKNTSDTSSCAVLQRKTHNLSVKEKYMKRTLIKKHMRRRIAWGVCRDAYDFTNIINVWIR